MSGMYLDFVNNNSDAFVNAYFDFASFRIYTVANDLYPDEA